MTCGPLSVVKFLTFMCFCAFFQFDCYGKQTYSTSDDFLPVVYVIYGQIPLYLRINIELASRNNDVVVISNQAKAKDSRRQLSTFDATSLSRSTKMTANRPFQIFYEDITSYSRSADLFAPHYVHLSPDFNHNRIKHELRCFQRWFVLKEFMLQHGIVKAFFGDGDSSVFMNIKSAIKHREHCSAIISIDAQAHNLYWCAAGESSVWTAVAIVDFCAFTLEMYSHKVQILRIKDAGRTSVVDMSLLWLWWVSHQKESKSGWDTGRPFLSDRPKDDKSQLQAFRDRSDAAYAFSKKLALPVYNSTKVSLELAAAKVPLKVSSNNLIICNGMDVVNRTVFDHRAGWRSGLNQSLNLIEGGRPYTISASLVEGGRPESVEAEDVKVLEKSRLYFVNLHYQGNNKRLIPYDVCRILLLPGTHKIQDPAVAEACSEEMKKSRNDGLDNCQNHEKLLESINICF